MTERVVHGIAPIAADADALGSIRNSTSHAKMAEHKSDLKWHVLYPFHAAIIVGTVKKKLERVCVVTTKHSTVNSHSYGGMKMMAKAASYPGAVMANVVDGDAKERAFTAGLAVNYAASVDKLLNIGYGRKCPGEGKTHGTDVTSAEARATYNAPKNWTRVITAFTGGAAKAADAAPQGAITTETARDKEIALAAIIEKMLERDGGLPWQTRTAELRAKVHNLDRITRIALADVAAMDEWLQQNPPAPKPAIDVEPAEEKYKKFADALPAEAAPTSPRSLAMICRRLTRALIRSTPRWDRLSRCFRTAPSRSRGTGFSRQNWEVNLHDFWEVTITSSPNQPTLSSSKCWSQRRSP
jgi:hypothetical protein